MEAVPGGGGGGAPRRRGVSNAKRAAGTSEPLHHRLTKHRLIHSVVRLQHSGLTEKRPAFWEEIQKTMGRDCYALWEMMCQQTSDRVQRLLECGDAPALVPPPARMTPTDWLLLDSVLVHGDNDLFSVNLQKLLCNSTRVRPLVQLFHLVQQFELETCTRRQRAAAWSAATHSYNQQGKHSSPMLLQRRWWELKKSTRERMYQYWDNRRRRDQPKHRSLLPVPLQVAIARRFPHVVVEEQRSWSESVAAGLVVLPHQFERLTAGAVGAAGAAAAVGAVGVVDVDGAGGAAEEEAPRDEGLEEETEDVVLVEVPVEIVDLDPDSPPPSAGECDHTSEESTLAEVSLPIECVFDPSRSEYVALDRADLRLKGEEDEEEEVGGASVDEKLLLMPTVVVARLEEMNCVRGADLRRPLALTPTLLEQMVKPKDTTVASTADKRKRACSSERAEQTANEVCKRAYSPLDLSTNPDFNTNLHGLAPAFFESTQNQQLLELLRPVTVDVERALFERATCAHREEQTAAAEEQDEVMVQVEGRDEMKVQYEEKDEVRVQNVERGEVRVQEKDELIVVEEEEMDNVRVLDKKRGEITVKDEDKDEVSVQNVERGEVRVQEKDELRVVEEEEMDNVRVLDKERGEITVKDKDEVSVQNVERGEVRVQEKDELGVVEEEEMDNVRVLDKERGEITVKDEDKDEVSVQNVERGEVRVQEKDELGVVEEEEMDNVRVLDKERGEITVKDEDKDEVSMQNVERGEVRVQNKEKDKIRVQDEEGAEATVQDDERGEARVQDEERVDVKVQDKEMGEVRMQDEERDEFRVQDQERGEIRVQDEERNEVRVQDQDREEAGEGEGESRRKKKRVSLPNISDVRRERNGLPRAQVPPLARSPAAPLLTFRDLDEILEDLTRKVTPADQLASAAVAQASLQRAADEPPNYCCPARRHRSLNDARRRLLLRKPGGRNPMLYGVLRIHTCPPHLCKCCCKNLDDPLRPTAAPPASTPLEPPIEQTPTKTAIVKIVPAEGIANGKKNKVVAHSRARPFKPHDYDLWMREREAIEKFGFKVKRNEVNPSRQFRAASSGVSILLPMPRASSVATPAVPINLPTTRPSGATTPAVSIDLPMHNLMSFPLQPAPARLNTPQISIAPVVAATSAAAASSVTLALPPRAAAPSRSTDTGSTPYVFLQVNSAEKIIESAAQNVAPRPPPPPYVLPDVALRPPPPTRGLPDVALCTPPPPPYDVHRQDVAPHPPPPCVLQGVAPHPPPYVLRVARRAVPLTHGTDCILVTSTDISPGPGACSYWTLLHPHGPMRRVERQLDTASAYALLASTALESQLVIGEEPSLSAIQLHHHYTTDIILDEEPPEPPAPPPPTPPPGWSELAAQHSLEGPAGHCVGGALTGAILHRGVRYQRVRGAGFMVVLTPVREWVTLAATRADGRALYTYDLRTGRLEVAREPCEQSRVSRMRSTLYATLVSRLDRPTGPDELVSLDSDDDDEAPSSAAARTDDREPRPRAAGEGSAAAEAAVAESTVNDTTVPTTERRSVAGGADGAHSEVCSVV